MIHLRNAPFVAFVKSLIYIFFGFFTDPFFKGNDNKLFWLFPYVGGQVWSASKSSKGMVDFTYPL